MERSANTDTTTDGPLSRESRANIVTARESVRRAASGFDDVDYERAIGMLDAVLASTCPHDPEDHMRKERRDGGIEVTCPGCHVSWVER